MESVVLQQKSRDAELSGEVAELRQEFQKTERKLKTALSEMNSRAASEGMSADCRNEIARLSQEIRKINSALSQMNSRAASEGTSADCRNEIARLSQEIRNTSWKLNSALSQLNSRATSEGNFTECSNEIARLRHKMSRLEGTVDRLVEDSRKPPSDPGVGPSGPKPKKYKQD
jgi:chromosome segregation ATPase